MIIPSANVKTEPKRGAANKMKLHCNYICAVKQLTLKSL